MKSRARSISILLAKVLLVVGVFFWLGNKGLISADVFQKAWGSRHLLGLGLAVLTLASFLAMLRWHFLLRSQSLHLPFGRTLELHLIGNFFNVAFPGAISGDFVKAFYVARELPGSRGRTFGSILFDRIVGVSALVLVSVSALFFNSDRLPSSSAIQSIQTLASLTGVGVLLFYAYLFLIKENHDPILKVFLFMEKRQERMASLVRIYQGIRHYHHRIPAVMLALGISTLTHLCAGYSIFIFLQALGAASMDLGTVYALAPLGFLVTAVPILPGGVGTGHLAFAFLMKLVGNEEGANAFSLFVIGQLLIGALGGIIYLRFKGSNPEAQLSHLRAAAETEVTSLTE